mmetsp:Transcript_3760/g.6184  ORF Transcript_3760/g.6184 Transcript_3760/m.6184 type:complete len:498 (+) Transcript_3760:41-1534(+)
MLLWILTSIVLFLSFFYVMLWVVNPYRYRRVDLLPGPPKHWLKGTMHHTRKGSQNFKDHLVLTKKYGGLVRLWRGPLFPIIAVYHAEEAKAILSHSHPKATSYKWVDNWLGSGLLTATTLGGLWKRKRRMITPAFHFNILKRYVPVFGEHAELLVQKWEKFASEKQQVNIVNDITTSALDIIGQCAFGYEFGALEQGKDQHPYVKAIYSCTDRIYDRAFRPWLYPKFSWERSSIGKEYLSSCKTVHDFATRVIRERRALWATEEGRAELESRNKLDFVDILLTSTDENGNPLTDKEIRDECNTFIFEGHDTTSAALGWTFYLISTHPDVEEKVIQEINEVLGDKPYPEYDDMAKLKYLGLCIKEGLRLYPSVPTIARYMIEDTEVNGKIIPKGSDVYIHPYVIHRQPDSWEDPEAFIPERHTAENSKGRHPFAFVPFSAGPRNCIGQNFATYEEKCVLAMVLRKIKMRPVEDHPIELLPALISRAEFGIEMHMELRN